MLDLMDTHVHALWAPKRIYMLHAHQYLRAAAAARDLHGQIEQLRDEA